MAQIVDQRSCNISDHADDQQYHNPNRNGSGKCHTLFIGLVSLLLQLPFFLFQSLQTGLPVLDLLLLFLDDRLAFIALYALFALDIADGFSFTGALVVFCLHHLGSFLFHGTSSCVFRNNAHNGASFFKIIIAFLQKL